MKKLMSFFVILFLIVISCSNIYSQKLLRHVIGSGGNQVQENAIQVNCTIGQTHIGLTKSSDVIHGVGYWYEAGYLMNLLNPVTVILIPYMSAEIGQHVSVPLILQESRYLRSYEKKNFEAKIRYNTTVLQPTSNLPVCTGDECVVTVTGSSADSSGVLANIDFIVRLGSVEKTPLIIESFKWVDAEDVKIVKQDGELEVLGICKEGDTVRLLKKTVPAGLYSFNPNPASSDVLINYGLNEKGNTRIVLINALGREIAVLFEGIAETGRHTLLADLTNIASGLYYVSMITPTERFSKKLIINK